VVSKGQKIHLGRDSQKLHDGGKEREGKRAVIVT